VYYSYVFQGAVLLWIFGYLFKKYRNVKEDALLRKKIIIFSLGIFCFLIAFSWGNLFGSLTLQWGMEQYGLFGMPIFIGFLAYLIVKFQAFDIKLLGVQALTITQFILIGSMVEELQMMSDRLATANQELKRLDNAKSEFISIASHQLRTPLTAIKGYTSLILEGSYGKIDNQIQDVVNKVYAANSRLIELVENLLSISRLESGRMQYNYQSAQLAEVVNDTAGMFAVIAKKKGIDLRVVVPETPLPLLSLDAGKIREVVSNLIDNALKYTETGSVIVKMEQTEDGKYVCRQGYRYRNYWGRP
jgi:signal transduction histidine kinase